MKKFFSAIFTILSFTLGLAASAISISSDCINRDFGGKFSTYSRRESIRRLSRY